MHGETINVKKIIIYSFKTASPEVKNALFYREKNFWTGMM